MASIWQAKLLFLALLLAFSTTSYAHGGGSLELRCHPDQAATLLELKKSFFFDEATTNLSSWKEGTDCCRWEGVGCGGSSGRVTTLSLSRLGLRSNGLNPVICNLTFLKFLDLSMTDFSEYNMSAVGLERLTFLTHLNLSNSNLEGEIPAGIGKLKNLVSLDLSSEYPSEEESDIPDANGWPGGAPDSPTAMDGQAAPPTSPRLSARRSRRRPRQSASLKLRRSCYG